MKKLIIIFSLISLLFAQSNLIYKEKYIDPVHAKLKEIRNAKIAEDQAQTDKIISSWEDVKYNKLFASMNGIELPNSTEEFESFFHFPPKHQGLTSSCWAHSGISFIESELYRQQGKKIKLSVMHIIYWDAYQKCRHFIESRGEHTIRTGSQINGTFKVIEEFGLIPEEVYNGNFSVDGYDTGPLYDELNAYLNFLKNNNIWDIRPSLSAILGILDKHLGAIPREFKFEGKTYSPRNFNRKVIKFNSDKYTGIQSTLSFPFNEYHHLPFPDHWWKGKEFYNLPIDKFYETIIKALNAGYSVPIGGDTSEPGYNRYAGIAFIPIADISQEGINQDAREYRINNESTGDDHAVHIVGYLNLNGVDWFLIKDSSRNAYQSVHPGYYYFRGDYVKLKMLDAVVPKKLITNK